MRSRPERTVAVGAASDSATLDPQVRRPRQNALCEGQDAFYVEFIEFDGVSVDLCEREVLAQPVSLPLVRVEVDGLRHR